MYGVGINYGIKEIVMDKLLKEFSDMIPKIIHTKTFYCDGSEDEYDQHPRVYYTFNNSVDSTDEKMFERREYVVCEYCYRKFKYKDDEDWVNNVLKGSG